LRIASRSIFLLQITDLHLLPDRAGRLLGVDTAASLDAVLHAAMAQRVPAAVIVTGDIAHTPLPNTYARARALLSQHWDGPCLWLPGNHDVGTELARVAPGGRDLTMGDWNVVAIDTHQDGVEAGAVSDSEMRVLRDHLRATSARNILVVGHHPPLEVGTPWLDRGRISNAAALLELLTADSRVKGYVCGHVH